jgi:hypothetical protein
VRVKLDFDDMAASIRGVLVFSNVIELRQRHRYIYNISSWRDIECRQPKIFSSGDVIGELSLAGLPILNLITQISLICTFFYCIHSVYILKNII